LGRRPGSLEKLTGKSGQTLEEELHNLNNLGFLYRERGDSPGPGSCSPRADQGPARGRIRAHRGHGVRNLGEIAAREGDRASAGEL